MEGAAEPRAVLSGLVAIYWVSCFVVMTRVLRDQCAPMAIAGVSLVALVWLEAFVWGVGGAA